MDDPRIEVARRWLPNLDGHSINSFLEALNAADRAHNRSYIEWRDPSDWVPRMNGDRYILVFTDHATLSAGWWALRGLPVACRAWAELPAPPPWAQTAPPPGFEREVTQEQIDDCYGGTASYDPAPPIPRAFPEPSDAFGEQKQ